jgi:hypothetical protein
MDSLDEFMQTNELADLLKKRLINNKSIINYQAVINTLKDENRNIEKKIWKTCKHVWGPKDTYGDLCSRQCKICGLYNNHYFYR